MKTFHHTRYTIAIITLAVVSIFAVYFKTAFTVKRDAEHNFTIRANIARTYISLMQQHVDAMRRSFEMHYKDPVNKSIRFAKRYSDHTIWALSGFSNDGGTDTIHGTGTGTGLFPLPESAQRELSAALSLDPLMEAILIHNKNVSWIYYTSEQHFIYLAPKLPVKEYQFSDQEYKRPFYYQAAPKHNPQKRQIISDLYFDSVGKGLMITISSPIYINSVFRGVVSLDLDIELLRRLTSIENIPGESILIDEYGKIVARKGDFSLDEKYGKNHEIGTWHSGDDGYYWMETAVINGELSLLQRIKKFDFFLFVAQRRVLSWILICLIALLIIFGSHYITVQKRISAAIQQSEEKTRTILKALPDIMFIMNKKGDFIDFYAPQNRALMLPPDQCIGKNVKDFFSKDIAITILNALERVFATELPEILHYTLRVDGTDKNMESRIVLKNATEAMLIERDLTDQKKLESLLHFERKQLLSLFDSIEAIIYVSDPKTYEILYVNKNFEKLLGHPVVGNICYREFQNLSEPCSFCTNNIILSQKPAPYYWEFTNPLLGKTFSIVDKIIIWPDGRDVRFEMAVDITNRKITEEKNIALLRFQNEMLDTAAVWINTLDLHGNITSWNRAAESISGYSREEVVGNNTIWELLYPDESYRTSIHTTAMSIISEKKQIENLETTIRTRSGEERVILWHSNILFDKKEHPVGSIALGADITEQKKYEKALKHNEERMELILKNSSDIIVIINAEGKQLYVSPSAEIITGYAVEELTGKTIAEIVHPDDLPGVYAKWQEALNAGKQTTRLQYRHIHKTRGWVHLEAIGQNLLEVPSIRGILLNIRDITDRITAENEKMTLQEQLAQSQKMESVGRLAGGVAHDFNNMLSVIIGHAELLLTKLTPHDTCFAGIKEIEHAAKRSAELTKQLLAFARKQTVSPIVIDTNTAITRTLSMLQRLIGEDINLIWRPGMNIGRIKIDPSQLDQMLANLCVNARDAIKGSGKITIETEQEDITGEYCASHNGATPGNYIIISVSDTGCGMDDETIKHLFEPFYTTKDVGKGTGLGLATIYGIIRQNNGFITVYSEKQRGTSIKIYLPSFKEDESHELSTSSVTPSGQETILLVEDEQRLLDLTTAMLTTLGYNVVPFAVPRAAIHYFSENKNHIDILLTDVIMPEMNGKELSETLLQQKPSLTTLYMSGYTADIIGHHGILDDTTHFIQKPFSIRQLAEKIRDALDSQNR